MENLNQASSFRLFGEDIEIQTRYGNLFVCVTEAIRSVNSVRSLNGYTDMRIDDRLSCAFAKNIIKNMAPCMNLKNEDNFNNISSLKKAGLAYRVGKGNGQKWFIHYKIFIAIFLTIDHSIESKIISVFINNTNPLLVLNNMSDIKDVKQQDLDLKTYIAIDRSRNICKIGKTIDLKKRLISLRVSNKYIYYIYTIDKDIESDMHKILNGFKIKGEWFDIDENMISGIAEKYGFKKFDNF